MRRSPYPQRAASALGSPVALAPVPDDPRPEWPAVSCVPRRRRRILAVVAGVVLAWMAWLAVTLALASGEVRRGTAALETARSNAHPEELAAGRPLPDLQRAAVAFSGAHRALSGLQWAPARILPVVGRQLR